MDPTYFRGIERLFIAVSGLTCVVLGFALFRQTYSNAASSGGDFSAKGGGFEISLRNAWPGVFFAAFGMIILVTAIVTQLSTNIKGIDGEPKFTQLNYQTGGLPTEETRGRAIKAIFAMGEARATQGKQTPDANTQKVGNMLRMAQIDLVDVAYGEGSYSKFLELASRAESKNSAATMSNEDRQFFEDLKTALGRK